MSISGRARLAVVIGAVVALLITMATPAQARSDASSNGTNGERVGIIGVFHDSVDDPRSAARDIERRHEGRLESVYEHALGGFAGEFPRGSLNGIENDRRVDYVELDQRVSIATQEIPTGVQRIFADENAEIGIDGSDDKRVDVDVAVIDTGIDLDHPDLNVVANADCFHSDGGGPPWSRDYKCVSGGTEGDDDNGHGTHVAGTVGAIDDSAGVVGVAPGAGLWAVKVLDSSGSGYMSNIVAGVDHVTANAGSIEVANMSLGCECSSDALDAAITDSVAAGVVYAVAAGNSDDDASTYSPANHSDVITVSALADFDGEEGGTVTSTSNECRDDEDDTLANFSNWGELIDIAGPGVCIRSTYLDGGYATYSGTSMASPHVAGAAGLLASRDSTATPADIESTLIGTGNDKWTDDSGDGTKEPLLDVSNETTFDPVLVAGDGDGGGDDTNSAPTASFTYSCTDLTCDFDGSGSTDSDGSISSYDWDFGDGNTATGQTATHTYASDDTYTVTLTVTDDDGATDSSSEDVSVSDGSTSDPDSIHVDDLDGTSTSQGSSWTATVSVHVHDGTNNGTDASGVTVTFDYMSERGHTDTLSCTTDDSGWCDVSASFHKRDGSVSFTVTGLSDGVVGDGHDSEGDSDGVTITVLKP